MSAFLRYVMLFIGGIAFAQPATSYNFEDTDNVQLTRISANSKYSDYSPFVHRNKMYFISDRVRRVGVQYVDVKETSAISDVYIAEIGPDKSVKKPVLEKSLSSVYHDGPLSVDSSGQYLFITLTDKKTSRLKIYCCRRTDNGWAKPAALEFCTDAFTYCHPAVSADGRRLYFSSDAPGFGGMDIFYSEFTGGVWGTPVNAGASVNSAANEIFPFYSESGKLYFSSNRTGGFGGLDLYRLSNAGTESILLPVPFNSSTDDFGIYTDSSGVSGFLSSNRESAYKDDIFRFSSRLPDFSEAKTPFVKSSFCYTFYEESSAITHDTLNLTFEWDFGDGNKGYSLRSRHCYGKPGLYQVKLNVVEKVSGEVFNSILDYKLNVDEPEKLYIRCADTINAGDTLKITSTGSAIRGYTILKKWWSFGDGRFGSGDDAGHIYAEPGKLELELWVLAKKNNQDIEEKFKVTKTIIVAGKKIGYAE